MMAGREAIEQVYSKVSLRLLPPLLLAYVVAYLDRVNVGFAKLDMLADLRLSETVYGLGAGMFFVGYFLFGLPSNLVLHRLGARRWIALLMIVWGAFSAGMLWVSTPLQFYVVRFWLGVAEAGFFPGVIFYLTRWYPPARRAKVTALFMTAVPLCGAGGSLLSGALLQAFRHSATLHAWQWLFLIEGLPAMGVALYLWARLDDDPQSARWLREDQKQVLQRELLSGHTQARADAQHLWRSGGMWLGCAVYFGVVTGVYAISFWLPSIVHELGHTQPLTVGALSAIPYVCAVFGMPLIARHADERREHRWHLVICGAAGTAGLAVSAVYIHSSSLALTAMSVATVGVLSSTPLFWSLWTATLKDAAAAAAIALINSFGCLAGFVAPFLVGFLKDRTGTASAGLYAIAAMVLAGSLLALARPQRRPS
jgi:MFS family permease